MDSEQKTLAEPLPDWIDKYRAALDSNRRRPSRLARIGLGLQGVVARISRLFRHASPTALSPTTGTSDLSEDVERKHARHQPDRDRTDLMLPDEGKKAS